MSPGRDGLRNITRAVSASNARSANKSRLRSLHDGDLLLRQAVQLVRGGAEVAFGTRVAIARETRPQGYKVVAFGQFTVCTPGWTSHDSRPR